MRCSTSQTIFVFSSLLLVRVCLTASVTQQLACENLLDVYTTMPTLIQSSAEEHCSVTEVRQCWLIKSLLLEKGRDRIHNLRKKMQCVSGEMGVISTENTCNYMLETPEQATELVKTLFPIPFNTVAINVASSFQKRLANVLSPIEKNLCEPEEEEE